MCSFWDLRRYAVAVAAVAAAVAAGRGKLKNVRLLGERRLLEQGLLSAVCCISNNDFVFQQDGAPAQRSHTVAYLRSNVPEFIEPETRPPNSPYLNLADYSVWSGQRCSKWCVVTKFQTLISWNKFWSTHTKPSDWSAAKKTDDGYQGKAWSCWISSGLIICARNRPCFTVFRMKTEQNSCVIVKSMQFWGYWRFMQIRQIILNCTEMQITHFILDKILKLLTYYTPFYH